MGKHKKARTKIHCEKLSKALKGKERTKAHSDAISKSKKGYKMKVSTKKKMSIFWKKKWKDKEWKEKIIKSRVGKKKNLSDEYRKILSKRASLMHTPEIRKKAGLGVKKWWDNNPEMKKKMSEIHKGKKIPKKLIEKHRQYWKGRKHTDETKRKIGLIHKGKKVSEKTKEKLRKYIGENASNWMGGLSFQPYSAQFNKLLKNKIRKRDNYKCVICGVIEKKLSRNLSVHHIDYDKFNCYKLNLISLCNKCHAKTGKNRDRWQNVLQQIVLGEIYGF